ncbi:MAG: ribosome-binding factor A [Gammaproteobacteria bacterium]|nr:ribosome-binding factor A [Gammaproteobacteria bacterium]
MNQSKSWLIKAKKLCGEIGPEDGVDPRIIARTMERKSGNRKSQQLAKEARHVITMVFAGELCDPVFEDIEIVDVTVSEDGQFFVVSLTQADTDYEYDEQAILEKCMVVQGYLRSAIAQTVKRKRVPSMKFEWVPLKNEVS